MKQRFSSLDVKVVAHELSNSLCSLRLANVYDLSSRIFLLKFAKPNHREQMVIDSGFRCHLSDFARATAAAPSAFVSRLRKYLKTRRVTSVAQIGTDRIIEFQFSDGQYKLFLEFYAGGNIVLTDKELNIIALLRIVGEEQDQEELRVGLKYSLDKRQNYGGVPPLTKERVKEGLQRALDRNTGEVVVSGKKHKKKSGDALRKALATSLTEFPPMLIDHALRVQEFDQNTPVEEVMRDESLLDRLMDVLGEANRVVQEVTARETSKGYIIAKIIPQRQLVNGVDVPDMSNTENEKFMYEDFHPFRPLPFEGVAETRIIEFEGFNKTVDEFFSSIEAQKLESRLTEREEQAKRKLEAARQDHQKRVGGLQQVQELNVRKAQAIEVNLQRVQEAIAAVNGLIAQGMDWVEIARLIEIEQAGHNPVAEMIKLPLKLYENTVTLLLGEADFEEEEDDDDFEGDETGSDVSDSEDENIKPSKKRNLAKPVDKRLSVDVDLALSPWSNARQYYDQKKTAVVKEQKTLQSSAMALKNTERKVNADLKKGLKQEKEVLRPVRKQSWFEKFYYFISSDGYLVLGGRDAQQNEILYKRHLKKGDVYVHADLHGAASIIVKNKPSMTDSPIPPSTLSQAGTMAVSSSSAWESKAVMAAWWVNADQVSKTALTGEYLPTGSFMIRGKKNFLLPAQLLLGFGVMFQISEESKARHLKHRLREENSETVGKNVAIAIDHNAQLTGEDEDAKSNQSDKDKDPVIEAENNLDDIEEAAASDFELENEEAHDGDDEYGNTDGNYASEYQNPLQSNGVAAAKHNSLSQNLIPQLGEEPGEITDGQNHNSESDNAGEGTEDHFSGGPFSQKTDVHNSKLTTATANTRHLSAKEQQLLRKGPSSSQPSTSHTSDNDSQSEAPSSAARSTISKPTQQPRVRGKHGQRLKQKLKYAHQDEEDRALALRLLGSTTGQEKVKSEVEAKAAREAELAAQKERRREQHLRAQQAGKEAEETRRLNLEEGIDTLDEDEVAELSMLDNFIGTPLPGDEILDALVVCGPWDAMGGKFRWRVKLQPGTMKKGKAVREILGHWGKSIAAEDKRKPKAVGEEGYEEEKLTRRERELLRGLKEGEVVGVIPVGKLRVAVGASAGEKSRAAPNGKGKRGGRGSKKTK